MKNGIIYIAKSPSGKVYVGQTTDTIENRKRKHYYDSKKYSYKFAMAIRKYGIDGFIWKIIHANVAKDNLNSLEKKEIERFDSFKNGYNCTLGGDFNPMDYEQNRIKVSEKRRGSKSAINQAGENNHQAKLTWKVVRKIRNEYLNTNKTQFDLAKEYKISRRTVGLIVKNVCWVDQAYQIPTVNKKDKLSIEIANEIRNKHDTGRYSYSKLAEEYGVCFQLIGAIINNKIWRKK